MLCERDRPKKKASEVIKHSKIYQYFLLIFNWKESRGYDLDISNIKLRPKRV